MRKLLLAARMRQLLLGHTKLESTVGISALKSMML
jgi:hypothetical protein